MTRVDTAFVPGQPSAKARASAEIELSQATLEAKQQSISVDTRRLSPLAFKLYQQRLGRIS